MWRKILILTREGLSDDLDDSKSFVGLLSSMVLPLLPIVDKLDDVNNTSGQITKNGFNAIGQILLHGDVKDIARILEQVSELSTNLDIIVDVEHISLDQLIQILDSGAAKVVITKSQLVDLGDIPVERLLIRLSGEEVATPAGIEDIANSVSGIIIDSSFTLSVDPESLSSIVNSLRKTHLPTGGDRTVYIQYSSTTPPPTIAELKSLALLSIEPIIPSSCLTSSPKDHPSLLSVAQIALLGAKTDRPDGLYATVVVDERNHALGLVYSSPESISETIRTGTGVYQSRERGLWYKGATSGATQQLLGISWDCDSDCLRYIVKQAGKGTKSFKFLTNCRILSFRKKKLLRTIKRVKSFRRNVTITKRISSKGILCCSIIL